MAGYFDKLNYDLCWRNYQRYQDKASVDRLLEPDSYDRPDLDPVPLLARGSQPSLDDRIFGQRVTQESFLQGRGQALADCPECDVRYLPKSVFPSKGKPMADCYRSDLEAVHTRRPRSCGSLAETDLTTYRMSPGFWRRGYAGLDAITDTFMQTRQAPFDPTIKKGSESYGRRSNYGSFTTSQSFAPYQ